MFKSFSYDTKKSQFLIAKNQVGDFGLHLSLIRSISWGNNVPVELPFYPGRSLPYHYYTDFAAGLLERLGLRIDLAFNGISIVFFTLLLYLMYKIPQLIFGKNKFLGITSVLLFLFNSSLTFIHFFQQNHLSAHSLSAIWHLSDYVDKAPFDNSVISIFFTMNTYLNQRHLIAGLAISLSLFALLYPKIIKNKKIEASHLVLLGAILGISSRVHSLIFLTTFIFFALLFLNFRKIKELFYFLIPAGLFFLPHLKDILMGTSHKLFTPGFLVSNHLSLGSFVNFWFLNLGLAFFATPISFFVLKKNQKKLFLSVVCIFVLGNLFQFSYRIDHNHSLFNFVFIFSNFFTAYLLSLFWKKSYIWKMGTVVLLFFLTFSGIIDLMVVKNDYHLPYNVAPKNKLMSFIKSTPPNSIFLAKGDLMDPVTLSGRKNYFGAVYYMQVLGYDYAKRQKLAEKIFAMENVGELKLAKAQHISYLIVSKNTTDFPYNPNLDFLNSNTKKVYEDNSVSVFKL